MGLSSHPDVRSGFASFLAEDLGKQLLRFTTAGSVDDGKSTLIGRLLYDAKGVYEDQLASARNSRINRSGRAIDFSLLTDGLRAEREQGITIDVAYRFFATSRRKFIIADTPGHEQYTRNMATGASTADLAIILIDAAKGLLPQTHRHTYIASLLGIPTVLAAVNKMDLVDFDEEVFTKIKDDFAVLADHLGIPNVLTVPVSALDGDNVVTRSTRLPWYQGPTLLEHLETAPARSSATVEEMRFPIQYVIRPHAGFRGYAGQVASGVIRPGDPVVALPSGQKTRVESIVTFDGNVPEAFAPMSVTLQLRDEIDLSRGDVLVSQDAMPRSSRHFEAMVVWLHSQPLKLGQRYLVKHNVRTTRAKAVKIRYRVNVNTLQHEATQQLEMNEIAAVEFETVSPLHFDPYQRNCATGSFILIDPISNATLGAAMIRRESSSPAAFQPSSEAALALLSNEERYRRHGHRPAAVLVEGRSALAPLLERALFERGFEVLLVTDAEVPPHDFVTAARIAEASGLVLIYSSASLDASVKHELQTAARARLFDLSARELSADDREAVTQAVSLLESLRIGGSDKDLKGVN
jgi:bifunctional enzyme CysN/CysC/sulfate adenylyltransferase subunit 1